MPPRLLLGLKWLAGQLAQWWQQPLQSRELSMWWKKCPAAAYLKWCRSAGNDVAVHSVSLPSRGTWCQLHSNLYRKNEMQSYTNLTAVNATFMPFKKVSGFVQTSYENIPQLFKPKYVEFLCVCVCVCGVVAIFSRTLEYLKLIFHGEVSFLGDWTGNLFKVDTLKMLQHMLSS